jgi:hypothetical protein
MSVLHCCDSIFLHRTFCGLLDGLQTDDYARAVPQPLPRAYRRQLQLEDQAKLERILAEVGEAGAPSSSAGATAAGDPRRLRGPPAIGRGCSSTIPGTDPVRALLAKERRRR